ncbi:MAG: class I SAM-dependent methyltransferase [Armatimonadota bacterium]|jgi:SAM-dependent methyltransferase|nr:class I SAM-dependent methyltransferase [Armatimonadota bacterium]MDT7973281.1 class I SAM-dependent methyltransferase [Armatimonadota bacterium]
MPVDDARFRKLFGDEAVAEAPEFSLLPRYYDTLMQDVPYRMWVNYIVDLLRRLDSAFRFHRILELACGTGTVALEFARKGCQVVGVDLMEGMVEVAREKARKMGLTRRARFYAQDIAKLHLPDEPPFDLALCLFDSLNYITDPTKLSRVFLRTFAHVRAGGYFVFDLNSEFALREHLFDQDNLDEDEEQTTLYYFWRSEYDPQKRLCRVDMWFAAKEAQGDWRRFREVHWQRAYTIEEVRQMATAAGWRWVKVLDAYSYQPPHPESERWYFVLRRP